MTEVLGGVLTALVGGVLAIVGAFAAGWIQKRATLRTRMKQVIAERKVSANADAYKYLKMIEHHLTEHNDAAALQLVVSHEDWLHANRLFLPSSFAETWRSLRATLAWLADASASVDDESPGRLRLQALRVVKEAMRGIYHDMDIENGGLGVNTPA
jgi:hypothetical protein